jgi:hypothetical protein
MGALGGHLYLKALAFFILFYKEIRSNLVSFTGVDRYQQMCNFIDLVNISYQGWEQRAHLYITLIFVFLVDAVAFKLLVTYVMTKEILSCSKRRRFVRKLDNIPRRLHSKAQKRNPFVLRESLDITVTRIWASPK